MSNCVLPEITDVVEMLPRRPDHPGRKLRAPGSITSIVVHYDAVPAPPAPGDEGIGYDPQARYAAQARYHIARNWGSRYRIARGFGLMYHYRVSADGRLWRTQPEELITWHANRANGHSLAVCCDLGPGQAPPERQLDGLRKLLDWLCYGRPDIPAGRADVWGHSELTRTGNSTECPGLLLGWVQAYRGGRP